MIKPDCYCFICESQEPLHSVGMTTALKVELNPNNDPKLKKKLELSSIAVCKSCKTKHKL